MSFWSVVVVRSYHLFVEFPKLWKYYNFQHFPITEICHNNHSVTGNMFQDFQLPNCIFDEYTAMQVFVFNNTHSYGHHRKNQNCSQHNYENTLIIQIRSGDIFTDKYGGKHYMQPPASYYENILTINKWDKVIFLTSSEPIINPVWLYLQQYIKLPEFENTEYIFQS